MHLKKVLKLDASKNKSFLEFIILLLEICSLFGSDLFPEIVCHTQVTVHNYAFEFPVKAEENLEI